MSCQGLLVGDTVVILLDAYLSHLQKGERNTEVLWLCFPDPGFKFVDDC